MICNGAKAVSAYSVLVDKSKDISKKNSSDMLTMKQLFKNIF